jgi:hypothetical protein
MSFKDESTEEELRLKKRATRDKFNEYRRNKRLTDKTYGQCKDPTYFQNYYQINTKGKKYTCDSCNMEVALDYRTKHLKTQKHIRNAAIKER